MELNINVFHSSMILWIFCHAYCGRAKHIDIKFHYISEQVKSKDMVAAMLTKALLSSQFVKLREMSGVREIIEQV